MPAQPREELVRAYQEYFRFKGGDSLDISSQIVPVVVLDQALPYPSSRLWETGQNSPSFVAEFSYFAIVNVDTTDKNSVGVVDKLVLRLGGASRAGVGVLAVSFIPGGSAAPVNDRDSSKQAPTSLQFGNLVAQVGHTAGFLLGNTKVPYNDALPHELLGPWLIAPGTALVVQGDAANTTLDVYSQGRYYATI